MNSFNRILFVCIVFIFQFGGAYSQEMDSFIRDTALNNKIRKYLGSTEKVNPYDLVLIVG